MKILIFAYIVLAAWLPISPKELVQNSTAFETITNAPWNQTQSLRLENGIYVDIALPCELNDMWTFNPDSTMIISDVAEFCRPDFGQFDIEGKWVLFDNDTKLAFALSNGFTIEALHVVAIQQNRLVLDYINLADPNAPATERVVLER
ncbi:MAG TPA: hypothetical protein DCF33_12465 [Saprospirales bacterium]|nr:hypothetical protein [Saprospirales bacterium]